MVDHPDGTDVSADPGRRDALDDLFNATYEELRRLAWSVKRSDGSATLSPTALVNEAWLKLAKSPEIASTSRLHFKRIAARAMRQVLIEAARRRGASKRGGSKGMTVSIDQASLNVAGDSEQELLLLDEALDSLARLNPRQAQMVEARFFGGMEMREVAEMLGVSEATVLRDWRAARAWLLNELRPGTEG